MLTHIFHHSNSPTCRAAGLAKRDITPVLRVRVVGLTRKAELAEGQAFAVTALTPISSDSSILYLQAKGSTSKWLPALFSSSPISSIVNLVKLVCQGEFWWEFDISAVVVLVSQLCTKGNHKKQWILVAVGSTARLDSTDESETLTAISFASPCIETDSFAPKTLNLRLEKLRRKVQLKVAAAKFGN
ncbi:hypothetical protein RND71_021468 [Anisodus tanguticus]|uniref:Uncharacterized protein n=1 Tax=Anisodus tanguticus TaxID=243964 RepID=A0AAE1RXV9_9SOLA|nr:hypothetical protein RND71_021468 [Anisodus tanguticus]